MKQPLGVKFNDKGQPFCDNAAKLGSFLGLIVRNGQVAPLNYVDWRVMPATFKNMQWYIIQRTFVIPPHGEKWVMMSLGRNWGNFKSKLKKNHYDVHANDFDRIADRDPRVHPDHWKFLVKHCSSDKGRERCLKNKKSRVV